MTDSTKLRASLEEAHANLREMEEQIATKKAARDAFITENASVYAKERAMANEIKALQNDAGALRVVLFPKHKAA